MEYQEFLWPFSLLPNNYVCLDLETTGLPNIDGLPDIVTLGVTIIKDSRIAHGKEFRVKPSQVISRTAENIHGISNSEAIGFPLRDSFEVFSDSVHARNLLLHDVSGFVNSGGHWSLRKRHHGELRGHHGAKAERGCWNAEINKEVWSS